MIHYKKRFCWLPTEVWSGRYERDGFVWFRFAYICDNGKAYKTFSALLSGECRWG